MMAENPTSNAQVGVCPSCDTRIRFQQVELGEYVVCEECGDELEVVQLNPVRLDLAYSEPYSDDGWDDDDDDDDDYDDDDWDDD
jgi:lysine biosynthesis protein LysW